MNAPIRQPLLEKFFRPRVIRLRPKAAGSLRLATFNAHFGRQPRAIAQMFLNNPNLAECDVIVLQEVEQRVGEKSSRAAQIASLLGMRAIYVPARQLPFGRGSHGLAVLSHLPVRSATAIKLPVFPLLRTRPRVAVAFEVKFLGQKIKIYNVHLNGPLNYHKRLQQLRGVIEVVGRERAARPQILAGDFNTIPLTTLASTMIPVFYNNQKKKLRAFLKAEGFETASQAVGHTSSWGLVKFQLDGIYPKRARLVQFAVERKIKVSDHFPLWADIAFD
ncbi:MAG: endonuclease/exonuclease/phosphatase family protein [Patescibacteria group bacterium]|nr:endonuclease/exonuclease/phosphatase family protein [Patescibacteria group bacterium]